MRSLWKRFGKLDDIADNVKRSIGVDDILQPQQDPGEEGRPHPAAGSTSFLGAPSPEAKHSSETSPPGVGVEYRDVPIDREQQRLEHENRNLLEDLRDRIQLYDLRRRFSSLILWAMVGTLLATVALMGVYIWYAVDRNRDIDSVVMVAWFSSTVVEVLGLVYIVANYLFPNDLKKTTDK